MFRGLCSDSVWKVSSKLKLDTCQFASSCAKTSTARQLGHLGFINYNNIQNSFGCISEVLVLKNKIWAEFTNATIHLLLLLPLIGASYQDWWLIVKTAKPDWVSSQWGSREKKARLDQSDIMWCHRMLCATGLIKQRWNCFLGDNQGFWNTAKH